MAAAAIEPDKKWRFWVRFLSDDVPGNPGSRHLTLARSFCRKILERELNDETDYVHASADMDKEHKICWVVIDINIQEPGLDVGQIPLKCFKATCKDNAMYDCQFPLISRS